MPTATAPADDQLAQTLRDDATRLLQDLLRLDTTSPPGNERLAAEYIAGVLTGARIEPEIVEAAPGRATVVARLQAKNPTGRPVLLMGHTDVVTVEPDKWEHDPFSGDLVDGFLWGRGALDMKSQVAGELAAFLALKHADLPLTRDVIFAAFADEEAGGELGADWVWKHHRDLIDAEYAINEGGGQPIEIGGALFSPCQVGEKGSTHLQMTARGAPGHASVPIPGTAMEQLGIALQRLHEWRPQTIITDPVRHLLTGIGDALGGEAADLIDGILASDAPAWDDLARLPLPGSDKPMLFAITHNTAVPTIIRGGQRINVIPSEVMVELDGRILPGEDPETFRAAVQEAVGDAAEITIVSPDTGLAAAPDSPFFEAIRATMGALQPETRVIPTLISGGTDAKLLPGIKVYGFFPILPGERAAIYDPLVHGHNERIHIDDLAFATRFIYDLIASFCTT
jgi:acetylornithine deacetylase/succinyl-diaminopimelate desuccinylase-like protein